MEVGGGENVMEVGGVDVVGENVVMVEGGRRDGGEGGVYCDMDVDREEPFDLSLRRMWRPW